MYRIFVFILLIAAFSYGLSSIAELDGSLTIQWPGGEIQPSLMQAVLVFVALVVIAMVVWSLFRLVLSSPDSIAKYFRRKKQEKGLSALSGGLIALGAGDKARALQLAKQARKTLPNDPMTQILRAQAAELQGDTGQATRIYESMLAASDTEILGLRGLYLLALEQKEFVAAEQYAKRAVKRRPDLAWAVMGLFDLLTQQQAWEEALGVLDIAKNQGLISAKKAKRQRAVLLTALALELEDDDMDKALELASEAVKLAPSLVPASVVAGRLYAGKGQMNQALKILRRCWKASPHPDLAYVTAFARPGDSVRDRLLRIKSLAALTPGHREAALAVAEAANEAKDWETARDSLDPLTRGEPSKRVCLLMARIEAQDGANKGLVREWLSRAVLAPLDPHWVADGVIEDEWAAVSPVSGKLDAFRWVVPDEAEARGAETVTLESMIAGLLTVEALEAEPRDPIDIIADVEIQEDRVHQVDEEVDEEDRVGFSASVVEPPKGAQARGDEEPAVTAAPVVSSGDSADVAGEADNEGQPVVTRGGHPRGEDKKKEKPLKKRPKRRKKTKIFVAPPAPDDPGTVERATDEEADDGSLIPGVRPVRY